MRRTDVKLTRLRIGHTRFTHRHLLLGENAPECPSCQFNAEIVEVEISGVAIYHPFGKFHRADSYCHLQFGTLVKQRLNTIERCYKVMYKYTGVQSSSNNAHFKQIAMELQKKGICDKYNEQGQRSRMGMHMQMSERNIRGVVSVRKTRAVGARSSRERRRNLRYLMQVQGSFMKYGWKKSSDLTCQVIYSQFGLAIHQNDHQARRRFVEWAQNEIAVVPDFHKRILFSDEAHFWLNGYVNKQNCRISSEANPQVYVETLLHPEKLTVWCALWAGGISGPYFFKNDEGHNVTVNGDRYRAMITNFFIPELNNHDVQELWFQQDGATCHTARAAIDLLKDKFGECLISRFGPVNWPPRSCDLTPLDYFLWAM
ncbi:putative transposable element [Trichonephila clavipes]|nr:putative transposable element [Trichonephila clavipes]